MKAVQTNAAPAAIGPYSQAIISGNMVYASGQIPLSPETGEIVGSTIAEQTEQVCKNMKGLLEASGSSITKVVRATCFLSDMSDFAAFNEVFAKYFTGKPSRSTIAAKQLPRNVLIELDTIAEIG